MNILEALEEDEIEVSLMNNGPIKFTKRRFSDNLEISYVLAPLASDMVYENMNRTQRLDQVNDN